MFLKVRLRRAYRTSVRRLFLSLSPRARPTGADEKRMKDLADFTRASLATENPTAYGAQVVDSATGRVVARPKRGSLVRRPHGARRGSRDRAACRELGLFDLSAFTLDTTCEPCAMCMGAALWAGSAGSCMASRSTIRPNTSRDVPLREVDRGPVADLVRHRRPRCRAATALRFSGSRVRPLPGSVKPAAPRSPGSRGCRPKALSTGSGWSARGIGFGSTNRVTASRSPEGLEILRGTPMVMIVGALEHGTRQTAARGSP